MPDIEKKNAATGQIILADDFGDTAGLGYENQTNQDIAIPFLNVLQAMSPEVTGDDGAGIEGARPGMLINSVTKDLFKGPIVFQPVATSHSFNEWVPRDRGGGLVGRHEIDSPIVAKAKADAREFGKYKTPEGNDLIETFTIAGFILENGDQDYMGAPIVISFTSTKIKVYKSIMTRLRTLLVDVRLPNGQTAKKQPPLCLNRLKISTVNEKNTKGSFWNFKFEPFTDNDLRASLIPARLGEQEHPLFTAGKEFHRQFTSGNVKLADESQNRAGPGAGEDDAPF